MFHSTRLRLVESNIPTLKPHSIFPPHENVLAIALKNIHYLYNISQIDERLRRWNFSCFQRKHIFNYRFYRFWIELCIDGVCTWWFLVDMLIMPTVFWQKRIVYLYFFSTMYIWINKNMLILVWATTEWNVEWQSSLSKFLISKMHILLQRFVIYELTIKSMHATTPRLTTQECNHTFR